MYILGISAFYHDSAAALIHDGKIVAAAQEERFSRKKHDPRFPVNAINYCLSEAFIEIEDVDYIAFYDNSFLTFSRIVENKAQAGSLADALFEAGKKSILGNKIWVADYFNNYFKSTGKENGLFYCGHHLSHAASAFYPSNFEDAAILTLDGVGEFATTTISKGSKNSIELLAEINYPHSLGLLYSAFTQYCGFKVNSGEYKLMGLAPYGVPKFADIIKEFLIDIKSDGSFKLNMEYLGYQSSPSTINEKFESLFGQSARKSETAITQHYMDMAASIQVVTEEVVLLLAKTAKQLTGSENLCLAGGVALNCVANGKLIQANIFKEVWIQPAAGDAGGALGAALMVHYHHLKNPRGIDLSKKDNQNGSYLGPNYSDFEIEAALRKANLNFVKTEDYQRAGVIAKLLAEGNVIGYFDGKMEFGPRALGARSIIADARSESMQSKLNLKIKFRESFRPFAPIVNEEYLQDYFDLNQDSPYMLVVAPVKSEYLTTPPADEYKGENMIKIINQKRSQLPAITHVDNSARIQTVSKETNARLHAIIEEFKTLSNFPVLVNTSFNVRGEPIVNTPDDAIRCFSRTHMDVLVLSNYIITKQNNDITVDETSWLNDFELD